MRRRVKFPLRPFDLTPPYLVDAAKGLFAVAWFETRPRVLNETTRGETAHPGRSYLMSFADNTYGDVTTNAH